MTSYEAVYGLMESLKDHLQDKMVDNIPADHSNYLEYTDQDGVSRVLKPPYIKVGRLQDDPTTLSSVAAIPSAYIAIEPGDEVWNHGFAEGNKTAANLWMDITPREIGGGRIWWRRFKVRFESYFIYSNQTQAEAARLGNLFRVLLERYCQGKNPAYGNGWDVIGDTFGFDESVLAVEVARSFALERGGPSDDYIWEGEVWLQVLVEIS